MEYAVNCRTMHSLVNPRFTIRLYSYFMTPLPSSAVPRVALPWIIRLRYAMAFGQVATACVVDRLLHIDLPLGWICSRRSG